MSSGAGGTWNPHPDEVQGFEEMDLLGEVLAAVNEVDGPMAVDQVDRALGVSPEAA